jgi:hypothetical protein
MPCAFNQALEAATPSGSVFISWFNFLSLGKLTGDFIAIL